MATWVFEPGHTAVEFRARHMMVCWVRGHFKDVHGSLEFDPDKPTHLAVEATLRADKLWTGEPQRDGHLRIRGISRPVVLAMHYLGKWRTPYWTDAGDAGPITRVGFVGETRINRQDFQVSWNGQLENGGVVVGDEVIIKMDVEALLETELTRAVAKGK